MRRHLGLLLLVLITCSSYAQNSYNSRFNLVDVDTVSRVACYDIEISNGGDIGWILGAYNLTILYDAQAACIATDSLISNSIVYSYGIQSQVTSTTLTDLPYRESIGFLRVNLAPEDRPASLDSLRDVIDTIGTWVPTIRLCFDLKLTNITSPETCLQINFANSDHLNAFNIPSNTMQEWAGAFVLLDVAPTDLQDIIPNRSRSSCFVLEENTPELCSDGIDNDEDGLTDCMDIDGCSPGILAVTVDPPSCEEPLGSFTILNGQGDNLMYSNDGGQSFQEDPVFLDVMAGTYSVVVTRNGVISSACTFETPVILQSPDCDEADNSACANGIDDDGDGLIDCQDPDCMPTISDVITIAPDNCPDLSNGNISIISPFGDVEFSIDGGSNFFADMNFNGLSEGDYTIMIRNAITLCVADTMLVTSLFADNPCVLPIELCQDGQDNDADGLIDCQDPDCRNEPTCEPEATYFIPNIMNPNSAVNARFEIKTPINTPMGIDQLNIFDRYGNVMFSRENTSTLDPNHSWDGRYNNEVVNPGVYVYQVILTFDGITIPVAGDITVLQ